MNVGAYTKERMYCCILMIQRTNEFLPPPGLSELKSTGDLINNLVTEGKEGLKAELI